MFQLSSFYCKRISAKSSSEFRILVNLHSFGLWAATLPKGPKVVPFWGSYLEFYKVLPKGTTLGPMGKACHKRILHTAPHAQQ